MIGYVDERRAAGAQVLDRLAVERLVACNGDFFRCPLAQRRIQCLQAVAAQLQQLQRRECP